jgi:hypothetical protein
LRESQAPLLEKQTVTLPITPKETVPNLKRQVVVLPPPETLKTTQPLERERQAPPPPETLRTIPPIQQEKRGPAQEITPREGVPNLSKQVTPVQPPETLKTIQPLPQKKQTPEPVIIPTETNQQAKGQEIHPPLIVRPNPPRPIIRAETPTPRLTPVQEKIRPLLAQESGRGNPKVEPAAARQAPSSTAGVNVARQVPLRITPTLDINASAQTTVSSETTKINVKPLVIPPSGQTTVSTQIRNSAQALNLLQQRVREGGIQSLVLQAHEAISHLQVHPSALTFTLREALGPHEPLHIRTLTNQASNPIPPLVRPSLTPRVTETVARIPQNNHNTHPARNPTPATGAIAPSNPNTGIVGLTAQETNNQVSNAVNAARQRQLATNLRSHLVPVQSVNLLDIIL